MRKSRGASNIGCATHWRGGSLFLCSAAIPFLYVHCSMCGPVFIYVVVRIARSTCAALVLRERECRECEREKNRRKDPDVTSRAYSIRAKSQLASELRRWKTSYAVRESKTQLIELLPFPPYSIYLFFYKVLNFRAFFCCFCLYCSILSC